MPIKNIFRKKKSPPKTKVKKKEKQFQICDIFREGISLKETFTKRLISKAEKGANFFNIYNESRIQLAFNSFDPRMKEALYEIIFLLHENYPELATHKYKSSVFKGQIKVKETEKTINLYDDKAPYGVKGIERLSSIFKKDFDDYILATFGRKLDFSGDQSQRPIDGIYSIGSIGTIGHKNIASDLDLEVQYDLEPFLFDIKKWDDSVFIDAIQKECSDLIDRYVFKKYKGKNETPTKEKKKNIKVFFSQKLSDKYPLLFKHLILKTTNVFKLIEKSPNKAKIKSRLIREIINLMKRNARLGNAEDIKKNEQVLKQRIEKIQSYIQDKFPDAEVYLFPFSLHEFRKGHFGSTTESKESSGSAYELILNYETLMPGIYFTPIIPCHFLFPNDVNNSEEHFDKLIEYLRFGIIDIYDKLSGQITNQGPTPDLQMTYVAHHYSAVYWEAFKASYGNLPKATLNLLRYEVLLEKQAGKTIIQLIKNPQLLDKLAFATDNLEKELKAEKIFSPQDLISFEKEFPDLQFDPWWLRYKALKIAYGVPDIIEGIETAELIQISKNIDTAFALHIRLSDVFKKPGQKPLNNSFRDEVLTEFLNQAFPDNTDRRNSLTATFIGDVETVSEFEKDLREIFQSCIDRVHEKVESTHEKTDKKTSDEYNIWYHFYQKNFKPKKNVIQRSILNHLQVPRGRLQIGFEPKEGWFFRSLQKETTVGKRFESSILNILPEKVTLLKKSKFLHGLAYCVVNGYYGVFSSGTLKETMTDVEYDRKHTNLGSKNDNHLAFIRPDQIERIMKMIIELFSPLKVSYMDCIQTKRKIITVMIFLNLQKYGRLSILYRDNLDTLYVDTFDLKDFNVNIDKYITSYKSMLKSVFLHETLRRFFEARQINPDEIALKTWVNTNSVETSHAATNEVAKESELAETFIKQIILKYAS